MFLCPVSHPAQSPDWGTILVLYLVSVELRPLQPGGLQSGAIQVVSCFPQRNGQRNGRRVPKIDRVSGMFQSSQNLLVRIKREGLPASRTPPEDQRRQSLWMRARLKPWFSAWRRLKRAAIRSSRDGGSGIARRIQSTLAGPSASATTTQLCCKTQSWRCVKRVPSLFSNSTNLSSIP